MRFDSQFCRMNCQIFSWLLSSGARGGSCRSDIIAGNLELLTVHATDLGGIFPRRAVEHRCNRQQSARLGNLLSTVWRCFALLMFAFSGGQPIAALMLVIDPTETIPRRCTATGIGLSTMCAEIIGATVAPTTAARSRSRLVCH
jgi:hypothetical protein